MTWAHWRSTLDSPGGVRRKKNSNTRLPAKRHYGVRLVHRLEELLPSHRLRIWREKFRMKPNNLRCRTKLMRRVRWDLATSVRECPDDGVLRTNIEYWNDWSGDFEHVIDQYHHLLCGEVADIDPQYIGMYVYARSTHLCVSRSVYVEK